MYVSSQTLTSTMRQSVLRTEGALTTAQNEVSSGVYSDLGLQLGGQTGYAVSLSQESGRLTDITNSNTSAAARLSSTSSAISSIMTSAQTLSNQLITASGDTSISSLIQEDAQTSLQNLIGTLNTSVGGQYIFSGTNTANASMSSYSDVMSASSTALNTDLAGLNSDPSQITGDQMQTYLADNTTTFGGLFQGNGWSSISAASTTTISSQISPSQTASTSVSASNTAFQQIAQAYAMLANLGSAGLGSDASQAVITSATKLLTAGTAGLTALQADVGVVQDNITAANSQMSAQQTILTDNVNNLEDVDTYTLSTKVTALQTQLQDAYSVTSQLKSLSLVNYLTSG